MARIFIGLMICFLFLSCNKKNKNILAANKPYIISYEERKLKRYYDSLQKNSNRTIPPPPKGFYSDNQLIINKNGGFYYYEKEFAKFGCGVKSKSDTVPHFINLKTNDLQNVPKTDLNNFFSEHNLNKEKHNRILIIASQNDTIENTLLFDFLNKKNISHYIRRTTQEEDTVLKYKKNDKLYNPKDIKWDQNRITLPFTKPKLEKTKK